MSAGTSPAASSVRALSQELKKLTTEPVEGFQVTLLDDENIFEWNVTIFGPPETLLQGGYFKVILVSDRPYPVALRRDDSENASLLFDFRLS